MEVTGNYVKQLNENHTVNALLGYSWQELNYDGFSVQARDAQSEYLASNNLQALIDLKYGDIDSWKGMWRLIGFFGRVQYNYQQKYHLSVSLRRDGSSKFGENNRWGWFPTAAIGWDIHKESFMNISWIDQLKLRLSYGTSGNQEIGEYRSQLVFQNSGLTVDPETGNDVVTFVNPWNANPDLKWEETTEYNFGIDYAVFKSRINGSLEIYYKRTTDLLGLYSVPKPPNLSDRTYANSGELESYGIELFVQSFIYDRRNFKWKSMLNLSHNTTKILDLGEYFEDGSVRKEGWISGRGMVGEEYYVTGIMEGEELGSFYLPTYVTMLNGVFVFESEAGGYTDKLSEAKRTIVGTAAPDLEIGWSNTFTLYRNWDLDINFRSMIGNDVYNATEMFFDNPDLPSLNASPTALDWEEKGRVTGPTVLDIYVEDGSFVRLDYLALGYNFSSKKIKPISNLKIYIAANNLFTITGYSGIDPETSVNGVSFGIDQYNVYPKTRTFSFGINATF
jgi:TonB-dependent starch-binding outer membrane protein SusC